MHDSNPTGAGQHQRRRPPGWCSPPALTERCSRCGAAGPDRAGVADLEVTWLLPHGDGGDVVAGRFCRACRPRGEVAELACAGCGDGPLLAGALAEADLAAAAAIDAWLTATGWRLALTRRAGPWCPACAAVVYPRNPTSTEQASIEQVNAGARRARRRAPSPPNSPSPPVSPSRLRQPRDRPRGRPWWRGPRLVPTEQRGRSGWRPGPRTSRAGRRAEAAWKVRDAKWRRCHAWCEDLEVRALPADPLMVARFLADLAAEWRDAVPTDPPTVIVEGRVLVREGVRPSTIDGYRAAIAVAHRCADAPNLCEHESVRRVMAGIRRHRGLTPTRRRTALRVADVHALLAAMRPDEHLADARDAAVLLIGWRAALRTDDLHRLDLADLTIDHTDDGSGTGGGGEGLAVRLCRSKTDQTGRTVTIGIAAVDPRRDGTPDPLDAAAVWRRWRDLLRAHGIRTGPAWRGVDRHGARSRAARLSHRALADVITRRARHAGLDGDYGGTRCAAGSPTSALAGGASERAVQHHGRWRSAVSMAPYVDEAARDADTNLTRALR